MNTPIPYIPMLPESIDIKINYHNSSVGEFSLNVYEDETSTGIFNNFMLSDKSERVYSHVKATKFFANNTDSFELNVENDLGYQGTFEYKRKNYADMDNYLSNMSHKLEIAQKNILDQKTLLSHMVYLGNETFIERLNKMFSAEMAENGSVMFFMSERFSFELLMLCATSRQKGLSLGSFFEHGYTEKLNERFNHEPFIISLIKYLTSFPAAEFRSENSKAVFHNILIGFASLYVRYPVFLKTHKKYGYGSTLPDCKQFMDNHTDFTNKTFHEKGDPKLHHVKNIYLMALVVMSEIYRHYEENKTKQSKD